MNKQHMNQQITSIVEVDRMQRPVGVQGVVMNYDRFTNTATVGISEADNNGIKEILASVPCPTYLGIQTVAPDIGRLCWVVFKDGVRSQPLISHFYNHRFDQYDYDRQTYASTGIPSYLIG